MRPAEDEPRGSATIPKETGAEAEGSADATARAIDGRRRRLTVALALVSWGAGMLSSAVHLSAGENARAAFTLTYGALFVLCLVGLFVGRRRVAPVAHAILALTVVGLVGSPIMSDTLAAAPVGLVTVPVSAVFVLGYRQGWVWTPLSAAIAALLAVRLPIEAAAATSAWNTIIVMLLLGGVGGALDRLREQADLRAARAHANELREARERSRAQATLAERNKILATLYRRTPALLVLIDGTTGEIAELNGRFSELLGWPRDEALGRTLGELGVWGSEQDREQLREIIFANGGKDAIETRLYDRSGDVIDLLASVEMLEVDGRPHLLAHAIDVRERKRLEQEIGRAVEERFARQDREIERSRSRLDAQSRLASIGTLAAGIAHQINNPIGAIRMIAEVARLETQTPTGEPAPVSASLDRIVREAERCGRIVRGLMQFARKEPMSTWPGDLNDAIADAVRRKRRDTSRRNTAISTKLCHEPLPASINPMAVDQILTHLLDNAFEASEASATPIQVEIETRRAGGSAIVSVRDDGPGMPPEALAQAFDPFFTTRLERGGTGLGLSIVHGLVKELGGDTELVSPGQGGVDVRIELPLLAN